jgi:hypothetical protein
MCPKIFNQSNLRSPIRRPNAEKNLLILLLSFAASVSLTRIFLEVSGYFSLGSGELHIAHVLWGGLLLFIATLLPLIFANRWVYLWVAVLSGCGAGLFIDEVGKFITRNNDYFYPPAAPIIYAFFLLTVLLYTRIRKPPAGNPRQEFYQVLENFEEVLDHNLDPSEKEQLIIQLRMIAEKAQQPDLVHLSTTLLNYLENEQNNLVPEDASYSQNIWRKMIDLEDRYGNRMAFRAILAGGMLATGIIAFLRLIPLLIVSKNPNSLQATMSELVRSGILTNSGLLNWFSAWLVFEGTIGVVLIISAILLAAGQEQRGIQLSYLSLLISLTAVDLLLFYFDQFSSITIALIQFLLLLGVMHFRKKHLS